MTGAGVLRTTTVLVLGAGAVLGAARVPGVQVTVPGAPSVSVAAPAAAARAITRRALVCPGPETAGARTGAAPGGPTTVDVVASSAPAGVPGAVHGDAGLLTLDALPGRRPLTSRRAVGAPAATRAQGTTSVGVTGVEGHAPTLAAAQRSLVTTGDARALVTTPCVEPTSDAYLVGGAGDPGAQELLVLTNPNPTPLTVRVGVLGTRGIARGAASGAIPLGPGERTVVLVDGLAPSEQTPVVHVASTGGPVAATLRTTWLDGIVPRGGDDAVPTTPATGTTVVAGALAGDGEVRVRLAAPSAATTATVVLRGTTTTGAVRPAERRTVRLAARASGEVVFGGLPAGSYAADVRAAHPVVAGTRLAVGRPETVTDVAWSAATPPLTQVAGLPLVDRPVAGLQHTLVLTGRGDVVVSTTGVGGVVARRTVSLPGGRPLAVPLGSATSVWLAPGSAQDVRAGVTAVVTAGGVPLVGVLPLQPRPQRTSPTVVEAR